MPRCVPLREPRTEICEMSAAGTPRKLICVVGDASGVPLQRRDRDVRQRVGAAAPRAAGAPARGRERAASRRAAAASAIGAGASAVTRPERRARPSVCRRPGRQLGVERVALDDRADALEQLAAARLELRARARRR